MVAPTLAHLDLHSLAAEQLVLATAAHESGLRSLRQIGGGPALGLFQMEPATHADIWASYLRFRRPLARRVTALRAPQPDGAAQLATNAAYACAMCRVHYWRRRELLPDAGDGAALGRYWKRHYNTIAGAGTAAAFADTFRRHVAPLYH